MSPVAIVGRGGPQRREPGAAARGPSTVCFAPSPSPVASDGGGSRFRHVPRRRDAGARSGGGVELERERELRPAQGVVAAGRHRLPVRVYYEDTDFSGVVYHAN